MRFNFLFWLNFGAEGGVRARERKMHKVIQSYACLVPFVEEEDHYFLKTVIPSRKATREHLHKGEPDVDT